MEHCQYHSAADKSYKDQCLVLRNEFNCRPEIFFRKSLHRICLLLYCDFSMIEIAPEILGRSPKFMPVYWKRFPSESQNPSLKEKQILTKKTLMRAVAPSLAATISLAPQPLRAQDAGA